MQINTGLPQPIDEVAPGDRDSSGEPIDGKLYATFWGLQANFKVCVCERESVCVCVCVWWGR